MVNFYGLVNFIGQQVGGMFFPGEEVEISRKWKHFGLSQSALELMYYTMSRVRFLDPGKSNLLPCYS